ncbi:hypothetical protein [Altererythrobacter sp. GH1-8]|uniref:hypothetical protein n=1 Tax=Altererythrobacter sp. GH1-8 TaxID=3349333 RepID=UPI00374D887D
MSGAGTYEVPDGPLCLSGPLPRPEAGALPLRGDLAHIALAGTHLAAHYVVPSPARIGPADAPMYLQQRDDSRVMRTLGSGTPIEILDVAGDWVWCCLGPHGPAGYVKADCLAD